MLDRLQFKIQDLAEVILIQRSENNDCVNPVHKLRRELTFGRFYRRPTYFLIYIGAAIVPRARRRSKTDTSADQFRQLARAQIRGHDDDCPGEIYVPVVAKRQCGLVENTEKQLPQTVRGLLNFIKQQQ